MGVVVSVDLPGLAAFTIVDAARDGVEVEESCPWFAII
jgi:hypothetical protein